MGSGASRVDIDPSRATPSKVTTIGLLGGTGKVGGFVLEEALARGYHVKALVRSPEKISHLVKSYPTLLQVIVGSSTDSVALSQVLSGVDVLISTLGSPSNEDLVLTESAQALVTAMQKIAARRQPRIIWMTAVGVNDSVAQGHRYGCSKCFFPSCSCCGTGYGLMGCVVFQYLVPKVIGNDLWEDMASSEDIFAASSDLLDRTVLVRPTNMKPISMYPTFSPEWRKQGGENTSYVTKRSDESPPNMWITRSAVAAFLLDLVVQKDFDGQAVSLFQGQPKSGKET